MDFSLTDLISIIPITILIPAAFYVIKVMLRTDIEIVLEDRYKNKMNEIIEIFIISLALSVIISLASASLFEKGVPESAEQVLGIIIYSLVAIFYLSFLVQLISYLFNQSRTIKNKKRMLKFYNIYFIVQYLSILGVNALLFISVGNSLELIEVIKVVSVVVFTYMIVIFIFKLCSNQVNKIDNNYEIKIINHDLNETLEKLILLYSLNKELLILKEKADENEHINDLSVFYVYYLNQGYILKYQRV